MLTPAQKSFVVKYGTIPESSKGFVKVIDMIVMLLSLLVTVTCLYRLFEPKPVQIILNFSAFVVVLYTIVTIFVLICICFTQGIYAALMSSEKGIALLNTLKNTASNYKTINCFLGFIEKSWYVVNIILLVLLGYVKTGAFLSFFVIFALILMTVHTSVFCKNIRKFDDKALV